ncbi:hypothetical protein [Serratia inhibens]|uniref:Uncharacterized protein n=1 Tax=Serratia inhibens TaxID=2338073 RepID=A0AA93BXR8_9GAMM|nr:hypothetical protein [Serratia inhibens]ANS45205.1 hypothetical protein Q5A_023990 [Serratia inhibens PRI-2C]RJF53766.1 hypothetical protein D4100_20390 [Serratia inhibens]
MDKPLPLWTRRWLDLPGWKALAAQWLVLGCLALLFGMPLLHGKWQQREQTLAEQQRLIQQIEPLKQQLAQMPTLDEINLRLRQNASRPAVHDDLTQVLQRAGAALQRWQQQEKPQRQTLNLNIHYDGLLRLLEALPSSSRIDQITLEAQAEDLMAHFVLHDTPADAALVNADE